MTAPVLAISFLSIMLQPAPSVRISSPAAQSEQHGGARAMVLRAPHAPRPNETAWLLVQVGAIGRSQVQVMTRDGHPLGTISPFGVRAGHASGTYTLPVPVADLHRGTLALRLSIVTAGETSRAPTEDEVKSVKLVLRP